MMTGRAWKRGEVLIPTLRILDMQVCESQPKDEWVRRRTEAIGLLGMGMTSMLSPCAHGYTL